jgi:hypothetical protein
LDSKHDNQAGMKLNLHNTLIHIKEHSDPVDNINRIIQKTWVLANPEKRNDYVEWIFLDNRRVLITMNENAKKPQWEFHKQVRKIIVGDPDDCRSFRLEFFNEAVLVLKKPLVVPEYMVFVNDQAKEIIREGGINYLKRLRCYYKQIQRIPIRKHLYLEVHAAKGLGSESQELVGKVVFINANTLKDGYYWHKKRNIAYLVKEGKIAGIHYLIKLESEKGETLSIISKKKNKISRGDRVGVDGQSFSEGQLILKDGRLLVIKEGRIFKKVGTLRRRFDKWIEPDSSAKN